MPKEKVWLRRAYSFVCPTCGQLNWDHPAPSEFTPQEILDLREDHGIAEDAIGDFVAMPKDVECKHCGAKWETTFDEEIESD